VKGGRYDFTLHAALAKGHANVAQLLVEHGADVNMPAKFHEAPKGQQPYGECDTRLPFCAIQFLSRFRVEQ
jgi:hypothetical protein